MILFYFGMNPIYPKVRYKFLRYIPTIFWIIIIVVHIAVVWIHRSVLFFSENVIGLISDILQFSITLSSHFCIVIHSITNEKWILKFQRNQWKINELIRNKQSEMIHINHQYKRNYLIKCYTYMITVIIIELTIIATIQYDPQWTSFWYANSLGLLVTRIRHLHHIFYIDLITAQLQFISNNLMSLNRPLIPEYKNKIILRTGRMEKLKNLNYFYNLLWLNVYYINNVFLWSQPVNLVQNFIELTLDFYWLYAYIEDAFYSNIFGMCTYYLLILMYT